MSKGLGKGVGIPVKLLHESEGHVVTVRARVERMNDEFLGLILIRSGVRDARERVPIDDAY